MSVVKVGRYCIFLGVALLAGCTTVSGPVPVTDIPAVSAPPQADEPRTPSIATTPSISRRVPLTAKLVKQADSKLQQEQWDEAIVLAERGLRIDRKDPQFYRVLASAYRGLNDRRQSVYFARQGLRYVTNNVALKNKLEDLGAQ